MPTPSPELETTYLPLLLPQKKAAALLGRSYDWLWSQRHRHKLYLPDNAETCGRGKTSFYSGIRLKMIAAALIGEITEDKALRLVNLDRARRLTEYALALAGEDGKKVRIRTRKIGSPRRRPSPGHTQPAGAFEGYADGSINDD